MMYSQDGFGLGHMRRITSIGGQMLRMRDDACILTLADSRLGPFFQTAQNHEYLKLPSIAKKGPGDWRAVNLPLPFAQVRAMRQELIRSAALSFRPHLFLVDHMPHGAMGELLPTLDLLKAAGTKLVLGLRDILDAPDVVQDRWQSEGAYAAMERYYDRVLVYGRREVYDLAEQYRFPPDVIPRMHYCGYVCTPVAGQYTTTRATYLGDADADTKLIVAMAGGGADAYPMMRALVDALPVVQDRQPCVLVLVTGPFMPLERVVDLQEQLRGQPAHVLMSVSDSLSLIQSADLVVAMAGYNTTMELLQLGKPAVLIPRAGPSAEQRLRARLFAAKGWIKTVDPDDLHTGQLAQAIVDNLASVPHTPVENRPDLNGLNTAVEQLLTLLPQAPSDMVQSPATVNMTTQLQVQTREPVDCLI